MHDNSNHRTLIYRPKIAGNVILQSLHFSCTEDMLHTLTNKHITKSAHISPKQPPNPKKIASANNH